jgi:hypothetical protein
VLLHPGVCVLLAMKSPSSLPPPPPLPMPLSILRQVYKLNALETMYLVTSMFILLAGMAFESGVTTVGSTAHEALAYIVMLVLVGSVRFTGTASCG